MKKRTNSFSLRAIKNDVPHIKMMHPTKLIQNEKAISQREFNSYLDDDGKFQYGVIQNCPICNNKEFKTLFLKNGFQIRECLYCSLIYASPRPAKEFLKRYYEDSETYNYFQKCILPETEKFRKEHILKPKLDIVERYSKRGRRILDVGCASGHFLELAKKSGWNCYGVEPNRNVIDSLKRTFGNQKIFNTSIENLEIGKTFDVITMWELIEHVQNPLEIFKKINSLLNDDGILVLSTPNSEGFDMVTLNELSDVYMPPSHINFFNSKSICYALKKSGFKKIKIVTPGIFDFDKIVSVIKETNTTGILDNFFREIEGNKKKYPAYKNFKIKFTKFLQDNKLSGHMVVIVTK